MQQPSTKANIEMATYTLRSADEDDQALDGKTSHRVTWKNNR